LESEKDALETAVRDVHSLTKDVTSRDGLDAACRIALRTGATVERLVDYMYCRERLAGKVRRSRGVTPSVRAEAEKVFTKHRRMHAEAKVLRDVALVRVKSRVERYPESALRGDNMVAVHRDISASLLIEPLLEDIRARENRMGNGYLVEYACQHGLDVNRPCDSLAGVILSEAVKNCRHSLISHLVDKLGADPTIKTPGGKSAKEVAEQRSCTTCVNLVAK